MSKTIEHTSGCITVRLTAIGGLTVRLVPVCATNLEPSDLPDGVLMTVDGMPIMTADGYWLVVVRN